MDDVIVLILIATFTALCVAYVAWCDRIIGPEPGSLEGGLEADADADAAGPKVEVRS